MPVSFISARLCCNSTSIAEPSCWRARATSQLATVMHGISAS